MLLRHRILKNTYRDSVALMQVAAEMEGLSGVDGATLLMATERNLELARDANLIDGDWYVNVHTANFGGGEIRGQVNVSRVPEPSTMVLSVLGLLSLLGIRRRTA